jgi:MFS family permease
MFGGMALAMVVCALSTSLWSLAAFALAYGVFHGGFIAILPALVMDFFDGRNVSGIIGVLYTSVAFGTLIGPGAAGFAVVIGHSYVPPILAGACANIIAAVIILGMSRAAVSKYGAGTSA